MSQHVSSKKIYFLIFIVLLLLTVVTIQVASTDLGQLNSVIAMTITVIKALLVILYFMHARYSNRLVWVFVAARFLWLLLLITLTMGDFLSRDWLAFAGG